MPSAAVVAVLTAGLVVGWHLPHRLPAQNNTDPVSALRAAVDQIERAGVSCQVPLELAPATAHGAISADCTGAHPFSLRVDPTVVSSYQSMALASLFACVAFDGPVPDLWFIAHRATWSVLTYDARTAERLGRIPGATVTIGRCRPTPADMAMCLLVPDDCGLIRAGAVDVPCPAGTTTACDS